MSNLRKEMRVGSVEIVDCPRTPTDPVARRTDGRGNSLPRYYASSVSKFEDRSLDQFWLNDALREALKQYPLEVAHVADFKEFALRPAVRQAAKQDRDAAKWLAECVAETKARNAARDEEIHVLLQKKEELSEVSERARLAKVQDLSAARLRAAEMVAEARGLFDPTALDTAEIIRVPKRTVRGLSGRRGLPCVEDDTPTWLSPAVYYAASLGIGIPVGLSLGAISGLVHLNAAIARDNPIVLLVFAGIGMALSLIAGMAVRQVFRQAFLAIYEGRTRAERFWWLAASLFFAFGMLALDSCVEQQGLLKSAQFAVHVASSGGQAAARSVANSQTSAAIWFAVGMILNFPYFLFNGVFGKTLGHAAAHNSVVGQRETLEFADQTEARSKPEVQKAFASVGVLRVRELELKEFDGRVDKLTESLDKQIAKTDAEREVVPIAYPEPIAELVRASIDAASWAQERWNEMFEALLEKVNPKVPEGQESASTQTAAVPIPIRIRLARSLSWQRWRWRRPARPLNARGDQVR